SLINARSCSFDNNPMCAPNLSATSILVGLRVYTIYFTDSRPSVRQELEVGSVRDFSSREVDSTGHIQLPNRIAAGDIRRIRSHSEYAGQIQI
ncbi:hypothetical protein, partial [Cohnella lubricantis]|uniref:hypothetical protein n=1 Tax=Cohnella lubricantis TaxID=2163172 RepID=UPI0039EE463C